MHSIYTHVEDPGLAIRSRGIGLRTSGGQFRTHILFQTKKITVLATRNCEMSRILNEIVYHLRSFFDVRYRPIVDTNA